MTLDEALALPGRKLQARDEAEAGDLVVTIYGLAHGGATPLASTTVAAAAYLALSAELRARGCELAATEPLTHIVWLLHDDGVEVFGKRRRELAAAGEHATLNDGRVVSRADFTLVYAWAADDYAHRGIKASLSSGDEVELVTEISLAATGDPTYNRNDLLFDSSWCTTLGRAIAAWARTPFANRI